MIKSKLFITIGGGMINSLICIPFIISCSNNNNNIDNNLKNEFVSWYKSLTIANWNKDSNGNFINFYCSSEQQAIQLYSNNWGCFWNENLHAQKEVINQTVKIWLDSQPREIRGDDYQFIDSALEKAIWPYNYVVWHGLEYMEIEFWDQLKDYIVKTDDGSYDYSKCIGKEITSYGWLSTSVDKWRATNYSNGAVFNKYLPNWDDITEFRPPLKENVVFKINIKKGYKGAAYLADFKWMGQANLENQVLIKRNSCFSIKKIWKEGKINIFEVDLLNN